MNKSFAPYKTLLAIGAISGWFAVIIQFYLIILHGSASIPETIIRFFSFFTILTNIIVMMTFTLLVLNPHSRLAMFFSRSATLTAVTVYITMVGLVYNIILRFLWEPKGLQRVVDELLHTVIPALFIFFWFVFVPKNTLKWKDGFYWLIYPLLYTIFILIRGLSSGYYPYPFINVDKLGYNKALINGGALLLAFFGLSLLLIAIGKLMSRTPNKIIN